MGLSKKGECPILLISRILLGIAQLACFFPTDARTREQKKKEADGVKIATTAGGVRCYRSTLKARSSA